LPNVMPCCMPAPRRSDKSDHKHTPKPPSPAPKRIKHVPTRHSITQLLQEGQTHHQQGQLDNAAACYREIIDRQPRSFEALHLLGLLTLQTGDAANALTWLQRAAKVKPADAATQSLIGVALQSSGQAAISIAYFDRAVRLQPKNAEFHYNLGKALRGVERIDDARASYETALRLKPDYAEALNNLSEALITLGKHDEGLKAAEAVLRIKPDHAEAWSNRASALVGLHQTEAALEALNRALTLRPNLQKALANRGSVLLMLNRFTEARRDFEGAVAVAPNDALMQWSLSNCQLLTGDFAAGWAGFGARWESAALKGFHPDFRQPQWDGRPTEQCVLVWGEQGIGDQILFTSMFAETAQRTPRVRFAVAPRLLTLYRRSFEGLQFCALKDAAADQAFDAYICMGDLGRIFRSKNEDFLAHRRAYLRADAVRTRELRQQIAQPGRPVCGLSWYSNNKDVGRKKSISLEELSRVFAGLELGYVDLQYGDTEAERAEVLEQGGINVLRVPALDTLNDIDGLASLVDACDVIVTISNTTAHLAGALGKRVFLMLPYSTGRLWYWQTERSDALWYPQMRIFRQPREGDWASVIGEVREALAALPPDGNF
jgi:Flp pilus assembly protein TadD